jgi:hypothetical protein
MGYEGMKCKVCGKKYHWCSSCGCYDLADHLYSDGWCSIDCWKCGGEYKEIVELWKKVCTMPEDRIKAVEALMDDYDEHRVEHVRWEGHLQ